MLHAAVLQAMQDVVAPQGKQDVDVRGRYGDVLAVILHDEGEIQQVPGAVVVMKTGDPAECRLVCDRYPGWLDHRDGLA